MPNACTIHRAGDLPQHFRWLPSTSLQDASERQGQRARTASDLSRALPSDIPWERFGDRAEDLNGNTAATGIQTRIGGNRSHFEPESSTTGTDYEVSSWTLQASLDGVLRESEAGALIGGINFHMNTASADISSRFGKGDIDTTGYGFDGTLTWYGKSGFYVDTQAAVTWYDGDLKSSTLQTSLADGNNGFGYGLSLEAGQKIALTGQWSLTPQAQLAYSSVRFDSFTDAYGANVSLDDGDSLTGRLGVSADFNSEWKDASGKASRSTASPISITTSSTARVSMSPGPAPSARTGPSGAVVAWAVPSAGPTSVMQPTVKPLLAPVSRTSATAMSSVPRSEFSVTWEGARNSGRAEALVGSGPMICLCTAPIDRQVPRQSEK